MIIILIVILIAASLVWFCGRFYGFYKLESKLKTSENYNKSQNLLLDEDECCYSVHLPTYLYWENGNLAISSKIKTQDDKENGTKTYSASGSMIILLKSFSYDVKEVGVILDDNGSNRQVYLKDAHTAVYADDQSCVDKNIAVIDKFYKKAETVWDLKMP